MNLLITPYNINYNYCHIHKEKNRQKTDNICSKKPYYTLNSMPVFKGKNIAQLYEEYNWYIRADRTPAIQAFLKIEEKPEIMENFLNKILDTKDRSIEFVESIVMQPRKTNEIINELSKKIPASSKIFVPFSQDNPYNIAYNRFLEKKLEQAHTIYEILKIRPDWKGEVLINKYKALKGNENVEIGHIPSEFPKEHFEKIKNYLRNYMEFGVKNKKKIESLKIDNRTYDFAYFTEGRSDKNVFGVFTPEGKKYVIKMDMPEKRSFDNAFALGTLAKIDGYLTANRSRNSAPICYYSHKDNLAVYKYIEHIPVNGNPNDLATIKVHLPDFKNLSLTYNDSVGFKNCFLLSHESNQDLFNTEGFQEGIRNYDWISVDNDHVTYSNRFQPFIEKFVTGLPNAMQMFF